MLNCALTVLLCIYSCIARSPCRHAETSSSSSSSLLRRHKPSSFRHLPSLAVFWPLSCCHEATTTKAPLCQSHHWSKGMPITSAQFDRVGWRKGWRLVEGTGFSHRQTSSFFWLTGISTFTITVSNAALCPGTLSSCHCCLPELISYTQASQ